MQDPLNWSLKVWIRETMGETTWVCHHLITIEFQLAADDDLWLFHGQTWAAETSIWRRQMLWLWPGDGGQGTVETKSLSGPPQEGWFFCITAVHNCGWWLWSAMPFYHRGFLKHLKSVEWLSNMLAAPSAKGTSTFVEPQGFSSTKQ